MDDQRARRVRVSVIDPADRAIAHTVTEPVFNANAQTPLRVQVEIECPCCGNWTRMLDEPVPLTMTPQRPELTTQVTDVRQPTVRPSYETRE